MRTELPMTCDACGITIRASEWADHVASDMHKGDTPAPDMRYMDTRREARDTWTDHMRDMDPRY